MKDSRTLRPLDIFLIVVTGGLWIIVLFVRYNRQRNNHKTSGVMKSPYSPMSMQEYNLMRKKEIEQFDALYDTDSVEGIRSIPIPDVSQRNTNSITGRPEYILQRKASEHKKSGRMDLAIACLKKSNELMAVSPSSYSAKDFMRLVEFLKLNRQFEEARYEEEQIKSAFPELFFGQSIKNSKLKDLSGDLFFLSTSSCCPYCSIYGHRVYSVSGTDRRFPPFSKLPADLHNIKCPVCNCYLDVGNYSPLDINGELKDMIKRSNRPFADMRTFEQKMHHEKEMEENHQKQINRLEYEWLYEHMPEICPKSLGGYVRMKNSNSAGFQQIVSEASKQGYLIQK